MLDKVISVGVVSTVVAGILAGACLVYERIGALADDYAECTAVIEEAIERGSLDGSFNTDVLKEFQNNE